MTAETALRATEQDQYSGDAAAIRAMRSNDSAVQWIALSGCRICEAQNATLNEIDLVRMIWTIPAERRKANRDYVVPITGRMAELLTKAMKQPSGLAKEQGDYLFVMPRLGRLKTLQGVRAAFQDWATAEDKFSLELVHAQLGHHPSTVEDAYSRKEMMEAWAAYVMGTSTQDAETFAASLARRRGDQA